MATKWCPGCRKLPARGVNGTNLCARCVVFRRRLASLRKSQCDGAPAKPIRAAKIPEFARRAREQRPLFGS